MSIIGTPKSCAKTRPIYSLYIVCFIVLLYEENVNMIYVANLPVASMTFLNGAQKLAEKNEAAKNLWCNEDQHTKSV